MSSTNPHSHSALLTPQSPAPLTRRRFLQTAAAASAGIVIGAPFISRAWAAAGAKSPFSNLVPANRKVRVASVGIGGKGYSDMTGAIEHGAEIVALCDVDFAQGSKAFREHAALPRYRDYRQMLDEMGDRIDAVIVSTPDHMHFPVAMMAIQRGKHVYVQKPLTHTIGEARALKAAALKHGVVTQMGNQGHANDDTRSTKEWIAAGVIGAVREVHSWTNRPIWPQGIHWPKPDDPVTGRKNAAKNAKPAKNKKGAPAPDSAAPAAAPAAKGPPPTLDWNLWLGVAPYRNYLPNILPFNWRGYWDYGCGALGDMGCHIMDAPFWSLNLTGNCTVTAECDDADGTLSTTAPKASTIKYEFPARGPFPAMTYFWHDGGRLPPVPKELGDEQLKQGGTLYFGDKGIMYSPDDYGKGIRLLPAERMKSFTPDKRPGKTIPRVPKQNPYLEWLTAIQGGAAPGSNIPGHAAALTEFVSLGNIALRAGKPIHWDAAAGVCTGLPDAQILIEKNYRVY